MRNVLEYLEKSSEKYPDKIAFKDLEQSCTFAKLQQEAQVIGSSLAKYQEVRQPVVVLMDRKINALKVFLGIVYSGNFYIYISPEQPTMRIQAILSTLQPKYLITEEKHLQKIQELKYEGKTISYSHFLGNALNSELIQVIRQNMLATDPLYCHFTSGSTGVPKGVLVSHGNVIDFMDYFPEMFHISTQDVIGNQAPFDFDISVKDIYTTLKVGATMIVIPKQYFSFVTKLLDYLEEQKVTTLIWSVSALCLISQMKGFQYKIPDSLKHILFSGEVMPVKYLKIWQQALPLAQFVNLYGPTEVTCNCLYHKIDPLIDYDTTIPIGRPFPNEKVFLLDELEQEIKKSYHTGEICVAGNCLATGYYNNSLQTKQVFTRNPLISEYFEQIYRTGDLAYYNELGEFCFAGRKDFQVKIMGHRIELEEIEIALNSLQGIERGCCIYDKKQKQLQAFYVGELKQSELSQELKKRFPPYMIPRSYYCLPHLPLNKNGKIDRERLSQSVTKKKEDQR